VSQLRSCAPTLFVVLALAVPGAGRCLAQGTSAPLAVTAGFDDSRDVSADAPIEFILNRALTDEEGELSLVVGGMDVTAVSERSPSRIVYRPSVVAMPVGETQIVVYRRSASGWTELRRFSARIRQAVAGTHSSTDGSATLGNTGQIAEGRSASLAATTRGRRTFQDFVLNAGLHSSRQAGGWSLATQSNYVGVTRREQALRFGTLGGRAPMLDLSDYLVQVNAASLNASVGHVTFGGSRHLVSGLAARGVVLSVGRGSTTLQLAALNGTSQLGWSDLTGLERATDRIYGASLGREMVAGHPGALRFDLTLVDGSRLPFASFTQGAVVDAEKSAGGSVQVTATLPNDRLHLTAGYSRSRFENPANDPQLRDDSIARPAPTLRGARFVEIAGTLLQNAKMPGGPVTITVGLRDERIDPLYRSVAAAVTADHEQDAADATLSLGAITAQVTQSFGRDNLADVTSILTTDDRTTSATLAIPMATMAAANGHAAWLPTITVAVNRTHQFANGVPTNDQFRPSDLPDQLSTSADGAAAWQVGRYRLSLHVNRSAQDNRQILRENADFDAGVKALSVGATLGSRGDVSLDLGDEYQLAKEHDERTRTRRLTLNSSITLRRSTGVLTSVSIVRTQPPEGVAAINTEERLEISQGLHLFAGATGEQRGQAFLRYARTTALLPDPALAAVAPLARALQQQWSLASGLSLRIF
jgi:hypothetical protein